MASDLAPNLKRCPICRHRSTSTCPNCGGMLGMPHLNLPPCTVCPHGRLLAQDIDDANAELTEVYVFEDDGDMIGDAPNPDTLEALALSNQMRIAQIDAMLRSNPERIPAVEAVLGIRGFMGS
jgi:hypothetical protein